MGGSQVACKVPSDKKGSLAPQAKQLAMQKKKKNLVKGKKEWPYFFTGKPCSPSKYCVNKKGAPKVCLSSAPGRFAVPPHPDWHVLYSYHNHKRINFGKFKQAILRPFLAMRNQLLLLR
ncbi:hypothetical protein IscW_ISCW009074 [Ixodes scapularis]|uniref:Uncharacterized protein n=1 Tax=Ixodes scapularis TaxID=6945 RepID=B7PZE6_IXOSC|nr:hypothetical protein IscW_ISCW009074 [Ixodes scapularis]|eukprot:XP_002405176.1 hypothetical protein IscW_ISCW009074 [Ixodes scapularis]